jgi:putative transposase
MTLFIDEYRGDFGVEPICRVLGVAVSTYYAARSRSPSRREATDAVLVEEIRKVYDDNYGVYGARRVWAELRRRGVDVGRGRVERLMAAAGLAGVQRGRRRWVTTRVDPAAPRPVDLVKRDFRAGGPDELWVADLTYVPIMPDGFVFVAFVLDVFSRMVVGWRVADHLRTDLPLDALEMALFRRGLSTGGTERLVHHSDRGCQYTSIRYTERLAEVGISPSVGAVADSYDNAMAESLNGTYKAELIEKKGPWKGLLHVEVATMEWVGWYNDRRLHSSLGYLPPAEYEDRYREGLGG